MVDPVIVARPDFLEIGVATRSASKREERKKLYIENSGGGGHKEAVKFKVAFDLKTAKKEDYILKPIVIDALNSCGTCFGKSNAKGWNTAKKAGNIKKQERLVKMQWIADILYFVPIFVRILYNIKKHGIHEVYDAQILGTKPILLAARFANRFFKEFKNNPVVVYKQMTDLVHKDSQHFFASLRQLTPSDKKIFKLIVPDLPILIEECDEDRIPLSEAGFWKKHTGLDLSHIVKAGLPVREAFKEWSQKHPIDDRPQDGFNIKVSCDKEIQILKDLMGNQNLQVVQTNVGKRCVKIPFTHKESDTIIFESVGSQVPAKEILDDVLMAIVKASNHPNQNYKMFVTCGKDEPRGLYEQVNRLINRQKDSEKFPTNLQVIPMTYQDDTELAPLLCCSNYFHMGAGGLTSMEAFEVLLKNPYQKKMLLKNKVMIRAVAQKPKNSTVPLTQQQLLTRGFSVWEKGNARSLHRFLKGIYSDADEFGRHIFGLADGVNAA